MDTAEARRIAADRAGEDRCGADLCFAHVKELQLSSIPEFQHGERTPHKPGLHAGGILYITASNRFNLPITVARLDLEQSSGRGVHRWA